MSTDPGAGYYDGAWSLNIGMKRFMCMELFLKGPVVGMHGRCYLFQGGLVFGVYRLLHGQLIENHYHSLGRLANLIITTKFIGLLISDR
jgi:hypothetical protein